MKIKYIDRAIKDKLLKYTKMFSVICVTGPRQSGKTTLIKNTFPDYAFYSLDDIDLRAQAKNDPAFFINRLPEKVIIDEFQYAPNILSYIKIKVDEKPHLKGKFILTGSQQFLMIKGLTETLAGRIGIIDLYPLSVSELTKFKHFSKTRDIFEYSCLRGTYPELAVNRQLDHTEWYKNYLNIYIERDAKTLHNIGNLISFDNLIRILSYRPGQILNLSSLANDLNVSVNTIKNWISVLQASGIIYILHPYFTNVKKQLIKSPKIYFIDLGLVCVLNRILSNENLYNNIILGHLFENFIVVELLKHIKNSGLNYEIFFLRSSKGLEIDLIIDTGKGFIPIEIKATENTYSNVNIELFDKLNKIFPDKKILTGHVICFKDSLFHLSQNIVSSGIYEFLKKL
ncbi:MAG: ATP-binding protein [Candidatus Goldbacteria bacterium]|nr:ATP-binding protein [Candidatus Goldiibacteriota bacterium]